MSPIPQRFAVASPARAGVDRLVGVAQTHERILWALVGGAILLDVWSTIYGVRLGLVEQNALARRLLETVGSLGLVGLKLAAVGLALGLRRVMPAGYEGVIPVALALPWWLSGCVNVVYIAMVW